MVDELNGEAGLIFNQERDAILSGDVFRRDNGKFAPWDIAFEVNSKNASTRSRAAHGDAMKHAGQCNVVHIAVAARDFFAPFLPRHGRSNNASLHWQPQYLILSCFFSHARNASSASSRIIGIMGIFRSACGRTSSW